MVPGYSLHFFQRQVMFYETDRNRILNKSSHNQSHREEILNTSRHTALHMLLKFKFSIPPLDGIGGKNSTESHRPQISVGLDTAVNPPQ